MAKKVTLQDVANLANVAQGTASQALNNKSGVSAATRDTVINAAKQLGYNLRYVFPDEVHTELKIIGVLKLNHEVFDRPGLDPFYMPVISGIEQECQKQNISMIYCTVEANNLMQVTRLPETIKRTKLDGLVGIGLNLNKDLTEEFRQINCPVVLIDGYSYGNRFDSICINNTEGAYQAVSYLIENGHRYIGLIGCCEGTFPSLLERRQGYLQALRDHNLKESFILDGLIFRKEAYHATEVLLNKFPQVTAIFACNDNAAIGAMNCVRHLNLRIPQDISIIGFDDISFSQDLLPPLSTMFVDKLLLGKIAIQQLLFRAHNLKKPVICSLIQVNLVERKSVKKRTSRRGE